MRRPFARLLIALITAYRYTLSPALAALGVRCRHAPSCSQYAIEAVRRHGAWAGAWMALARLQRCHPWGTHGHDPAPESLPENTRWRTPWRYGDWRGPKKSARQKSTSGESPIDSPKKAERI